MLPIEMIKSSKSDYFTNEFLVTDTLHDMYKIYIDLPKEYTLKFYEERLYLVDGVKYYFQSAKPFYVDLNDSHNKIKKYSSRFIDYLKLNL